MIVQRAPRYLTSLDTSVHDSACSGEGNRDGSNDNFSWNCGCEGETEDAGVNALRARQIRNLHLALMVSQGMPMVLMGALAFGCQAALSQTCDGVCLTVPYAECCMSFLGALGVCHQCSYLQLHVMPGAC